MVSRTCVTIYIQRTGRKVYISHNMSYSPPPLVFWSVIRKVDSVLLESIVESKYFVSLVFCMVLYHVLQCKKLNFP
jgi:hypothetical protein